MPLVFEYPVGVPLANQAKVVPGVVDVNEIALLVPEHIVGGVTAVTVGKGVIATTKLLDTAVHTPLPVVVAVSVTFPAVLSAEVKLYTEFVLVLFGVNVPVPELVQ